MNEPQQLWNESGMADGLVGDYLPTALFYYPVSQVPVPKCTKRAADLYCNVSTRASSGCKFCAGPCANATKNGRSPACQACTNTTKSQVSACVTCQKTLGAYCKMDLAWGVNNNDPTKCQRCVARLTNATSYGPEYRHWTYLNIPKADMGRSREQGTWMRFQQVACAGPDMAPPCRLHDWPMYVSPHPSALRASCLITGSGYNLPRSSRVIVGCKSLVGVLINVGGCLWWEASRYWDTMWFSRFPGANVTDTAYQTLVTGPANASSPSVRRRCPATFQNQRPHFFVKVVSFPRSFHN